MTWAVDQPHNRRRWNRQSEVVTPSGVRATVRPLGAAGVGLAAALVGAWGAISVFVGPDFGFRPTTASAWQWTMDNWLLHLIPGAVAVAAGLMITSLSPGRRAGAGTGGVLGLAALLLVAAGAWFVLGPAVWPTFESSVPFATGTTTGRSFLYQFGSSLGPGLLLAVLGGMALKAGIARPAVALGEAASPAATGVESTAVVERHDEATTNAAPAVTESRRAEEAGGPAPEVRA